MYWPIRKFSFENAIFHIKNINFYQLKFSCVYQIQSLVSFDSKIKLESSAANKPI
jgi:hypothetical protein